MNAPMVKIHQGIMVVRDDVIPGGTKATVIPRLFEAGVEEYVYASPVQGFAQIALAIAAPAAYKTATIICAKRAQRHANTRRAADLGARIIEVEPGYMSVCRRRAQDYCSVSGARLLPFGLDSEVILDAIAQRALATELNPSEVWCAAGSGVLTRALQRAWPYARHHAVQVGAVPFIGSAELHHAPETFEKAADYPPPFPSCANYDAKVWRFVKARPRGTVFWNVAA